MSYAVVVKDDTLALKFVESNGIRKSIFKPSDFSITVDNLLYESHISLGDGYHSAKARNLLTTLIMHRQLTTGAFIPTVRETIRKRLITGELRLPYQEHKAYRYGDKVGDVEVYEVKDSRVRVKALTTFTLNCGKVIRKNSVSGLFPAHQLYKFAEKGSIFWVEKCAEVSRSNLKNCYIRGINMMDCDIANSVIRGNAVGDLTLRGLASKSEVHCSNIANSTLVFSQSATSGIYKSELDDVSIEKCRGSFEIRNSKLHSVKFSRTPMVNIVDSLIGLSSFYVPVGAKGQLLVSYSYVYYVNCDTCSTIDDSHVTFANIVRSELTRSSMVSPYNKRIHVSDSILSQVAFVTLQQIYGVDCHIGNIIFSG